MTLPTLTVPTLAVPTIIRYIRYQSIINKIYKNENLQNNLSALFGVKFEKDWIGRLWTVINPYIQDIDNEQNSSTSVFQYGKDGMLTNEFAIERWVMERMNIAGEFIVNNNLFELLSYKIEKIDDDANYLFVMHNIALDDLKRVLKRMCWVVPVLAIVAVILMKIL